MLSIIEVRKSKAKENLGRERVVGLLSKFCLYLHYKQGFLTFCIVLELLFKKTTRENLYFQLYNQAAVTLTFSIKRLYLYCLFLNLAVVTGGS